MTLDWTGVSGDMDLFVIDRNPVTAFQCVFATIAIPETGPCTLAAGDFAAWVNEYNHLPGFTVYTLTITP